MESQLSHGDGVVSQLSEDDTYMAKMVSAVSRAKPFFSSRIMLLDKPQIIVIDIDGTALDTTKPIPFEIMCCKEIPPVLDLYHSLRAMGYVMIFLTARQEQFRMLTEYNLNKVGYVGYAKVIMMPQYHQNYSIPEIIRWKDEQRRILKEDSHIVGCIGDQDADVCGDHIGEYQLRLPPQPKIGLTGLLARLITLGSKK
jgi:hypothetical protein